jgi:phosphonopyruvate decarboxylase|tara:strand:+ start:2062 stop:3168 length:1107 start_codon:yes stop_codon:yes gene_type:complete
MISSGGLVRLLKKNNINFFTGVPDSVLKYLTPYFEKNKKNHVIAVNEGNAVAIATGYHLSTGKIACVYLQNSGLGNAVNPLSSVTHSKVYSVPMLLLIGWRGSPGSNDEPQHQVKGQITKKLLTLLSIEYCTIQTEKDFKKLNSIIKFSKKLNKPVACLIENKILKEEIKNRPKKTEKTFLKRINIIEKIINGIKNKTNIVATTGFTSRELMELQKNKKKSKYNSFYMIGGMGHSAAVSLGVSIGSKKNIICFDGDGSLLMHLGSMASIGFFGRKNFKHILFNNNSHESVGGQTTNARNINFEKVSKGLGYKKYFLINDEKKITQKIKIFLKSKGPAFLEIMIDQGSVKDLMRPKNLIEIKKKFMKKI